MEGELLDVVERIVISPVAGVFVPIDDLESGVEAGATIGFVRVGDNDVPVRSPFGGRIMQVVAVQGERLVPYQRIAWMRAA